MKKSKVLIDCAPGIDDSLALMLALSSPELEIAGITTVCGNVPPDMGAQNVLRVLKFMDRLDIPVYQGADRPLSREYVSAQDTHGMDGLGEAGLEEFGLKEVPEGRISSGAAEFILDELEFMTMFMARLFVRQEEEIRGVLNQIMVTGGGSR